MKNYTLICVVVAYLSLELLTALVSKLYSSVLRLSLFCRSARLEVQYCNIYQIIVSVYII